MNPGLKSIFKAVTTFLSLFLAGYLVVFSFQNCSRARLGVQEVNSKVAGLDVNGPQDVAPTCATGKVAIGLNSGGLALCVTPLNVSGSRLCGPNEYIYTDATTSVQCIAVADRDPTGTLCPYNQQMTSFVDALAMTCTQMPGATVSCPTGQWLRGFDTNGQTVCSGNTNPTPTPGPSSTPSSSPSPNPSPSASPSSSPMPTATPGGPTNVACLPGQFLEAIVNAVAVCKPILPAVNPANSCPAGQAVVGQTGTNVHCQTLMTIPQANTLCLGGMYLVDYGNGAITCANLPTSDYAHYCGDGKYLKTITSQGFLCENIPTNLQRFNGTCAPGFYLQGFENQAPKCLPVTTVPTYNHNCPRGFYASAISNGVLICVSHQNGGLLCSPGSQRSCAVNNGVGSQTCAPDGKMWGSCVPNSCNVGFELSNMACVPSTCPAGYVKENGQCVDKTPPVVNFSVLPPPVTDGRSAKFAFTATDAGSGIDTLVCRVDTAEFVNCATALEFQITWLGLHKFELKAKDKAGNVTLVSYSWTVVALPPVCQPGNKIICKIGNAHGYQFCNADGSGYSTCLANACPIGYEMKNGCCVLSNCSSCHGSCVAGTAIQCDIPNGIGQATCKTTGQGFGECLPKSCNQGYVLTNGICVLSGATPPPAAVPTAQVGWISTNGKESHQQTCARVGLMPYTGSGMNGLGICAADESAPGIGSGANWDKISYPNNLRHLTKKLVYQQKQGGTVITKSGSTYYCYKSGQKKDSDKTDRVAAYLCK